MKAVILAGGRGERLRPITDTRPKPLVPVLARPVMDYCLSLLSHHGVTEAYVTTHYLADQIRHRYGKEAFGMALSYSLEKTPLGTAGGVKLLEKHLLKEECFLVMSGDALCDFDLKSAVAFHKEKKADVTVILSSVKTPLEYGVVLSDTFEKIFAFSEKPDWSETFSDQVNTGVYILSPGILSKIPTSCVFDFARDLFPLLLREGYRLFGYKEKGYWCDIGKIPTLYRCNLDVLGGKAKTYLPPCGTTRCASDGKGKYFVSHTARVSEDAVIRSGTVISEGAEIAAGARISSSLILEKAKMEKNSSLQSGILCEGAAMREDAVALPGSVLGAGSVVLPEGIAKGGRKYPPYSVIRPESAFEEDGLMFTEDGVSAGDTPGLSEQDASYLGRAMASALRSDILVLWDKKEGSAYFASLFASGVICKGQNARLLGEGSSETASFGAALYRSPAVFVTSEDKRGAFFAFAEDGLPLPRRDVLRILRLPREDAAWSETGDLVREASLAERYRNALSEEMGPLTGLKVGFAPPCPSDLKEAVIKSGGTAYNGKDGDLSLLVCGNRVKCFLCGEKLADTEKIRLFLLERELKRGKTRFFLPDSLPGLFAEHVKSRGGSAFSVSYSDSVSEGGRKELIRSRWLYDANFLAARMLRVFAEEPRENIKKEFLATPDIYISRLQYVPKEENKAKLLGLAPREIKEKGAQVRLRPGYYGIRIVSEAYSVEAALEHVFECRGNLYEIEKNIGGR